MSEALALDYGYSDPYRTELIDGKTVLMAPSPGRDHNFSTGNIFSIFRSHFKGKPCTVFMDGADLVLSEKDRFIPDMMVVCDRDKIKHDGVYGAPDLVVEVLSKSTAKRDRGYKKDLYERHGVKEYWIVDVVSRIVEVYLLTENRYALISVYVLHTAYMVEKMKKEGLDSEIVTEFSPSIFPELTVDLYEVFEGLLPEGEY